MKKERYELLYDDIIYDNTEKCYIVSPNKSKRDYMKSITTLLNQQDARIKELESKLRVSNNQFASSELKYNELEKNYKKQEDLLSTYLKNCSELKLENQQLKQQLEEKDKEIGKLSLYSDRLFKLEARIGLEERTVGDVVEELDRLRNQLEQSQIENQLLKQQLEEKDKVIDMQKSIQRYDIGDMLVENTKLKQSQNEKAIEVLEKIIEYIRNCETEPRYWDISQFIDNQIKYLKG